MDEIRRRFGEISEKYDQEREQLIPCFQDFYHISLPLIQNHYHAENLLDIGAGTGLFSYFVYQVNPKLKYTLLDISPEMLAVAKRRFTGLSHFSYLEMDYRERSLPGKYDIIISSLSIHHLTDQEKSILYQRIFKALKPDGLFINADQVKGRTPAIDNFYQDQWRRSVIESGLNQEAIQNAFKRTALDKLAPLSWQLNELQRIGFNEVDCIYRYHNFVVMIGRKS
ncbi:MULTISPECIES: class I SAM-dependent methyltransferase [Olivibacter]|jgi:tRNA (cmo5U34)-methyltransferase|uniref:Class I SAM-dependent methyltransferase n=1 Tax=Olivibacter oleidegradans TaxID=760123 RepID=A0ABV6HK71_9SPHI|nr:MULTISPECIES: class I SAM-dependent methyltransferase [unclassified Olivibacter]MCL4637362.1 methyltransferase domain-containing protein [Olivibacter sp. UJ_SKK_5.1]MDM8176512.1 methyltransferase domain-containing protein [Olivibacter sp. 47]QEL00775.1 methyltransferase domain-containing protein [Olivibacter sp. LS-1]